MACWPPSSSHRKPDRQVDSAGPHAAIREVLDLAEIVAICGPGPRPVDLQACGCRDVSGPSGVDGFEVIRLTHRTGGTVTKAGREIIEI
jgi:hypothetical protein